MTWLSRTLEDWFDDIFLSVIVLLHIGFVVLSAALFSLPVWLIAGVLDTYDGGELWGTVAMIVCVIVFGPRLLRVSLPAVIEVFEEKETERQRRVSRSQQERSR